MHQLQRSLNSFKQIQSNISDALLPGACFTGGKREVEPRTQYPLADLLHLSIIDGSRTVVEAMSDLRGATLMRCAESDCIAAD
jgi:hypothetical protein